MIKFTKLVVFAFGIYFFSWLAVYLTGVNKLAIQSEDTLPAMFIPVTLIKEKTLYADTYYNYIKERYPHPDDKSFEKGLTPFYFKQVASHYISAFPIMTGFLVVPVYFPPLVLGLSVTFENLVFLAHISSALIVALSGGVLFLLLKKYLLKDERHALWLTLIYLFGTINYALISQALWQHGTLQLFLLLSLYFLYKSLSAQRLRHVFLSTLFLGFAILTRPTAVIFVPFLFLIFVGKSFVSVKKAFLSMWVYVTGFLPALLFFVWYNAVFYLDISNQGYASQILSEWLSKFPEGFLGLWLSPSKGLLIYTPVFILSLFGFVLSLRKKISTTDFEYIIYGCIVLLYTLVMGKWKHWYGGWSFGYRMASDIIPFLILLLVPYVKSAFFSKKLLIGLTIFSIVVQIYGMIFFDGIWHSAYDRGFTDTAWLWSIKDSEIAFNVRRVLVKVGVLERACPQCLAN